jgi:hypothetical protein
VCFFWLPLIWNKKIAFYEEREEEERIFFECPKILPMVELGGMFPKC